MAFAAPSHNALYLSEVFNEDFIKTFKNSNLNITQIVEESSLNLPSNCSSSATGSQFFSPDVINTIDSLFDISTSAQSFFKGDVTAALNQIVSVISESDSSRIINSIITGQSFSFEDSSKIANLSSTISNYGSYLEALSSNSIQAAKNIFATLNTGSPLTIPIFSSDDSAKYKNSRDYLNSLLFNLTSVYGSESAANHFITPFYNSTLFVNDSMLSYIGVSSIWKNPYGIFNPIIPTSSKMQNLCITPSVYSPSIDPIGFQGLGTDPFAISSSKNADIYSDYLAKNNALELQPLQKAINTYFEVTSAQNKTYISVPSAETATKIIDGIVSYLSPVLNTSQLSSYFNQVDNCIQSPLFNIPILLASRDLYALKDTSYSSSNSFLDFPYSNFTMINGSYPMICLGPPSSHNINRLKLPKNLFDTNIFTQNTISQSSFKNAALDQQILKSDLEKLINVVSSNTPHGSPYLDKLWSIYYRDYAPFNTTEAAQASTILKNLTQSYSVLQSHLLSNLKTLLLNWAPEKIAIIDAISTNSTQYKLPSNLYGNLSTYQDLLNITQNDADECNNFFGGSICNTPPMNAVPIHSIAYSHSTNTLSGLSFSDLLDHIFPEISFTPFTQLQTSIYLEAQVNNSSNSITNLAQNSSISLKTINNNPPLQLQYCNSLTAMLNVSVSFPDVTAPTTHLLAQNWQNLCNNWLKNQGAGRLVLETRSKQELDNIATALNNTLAKHHVSYGVTRLSDVIYASPFLDPSTLVYTISANDSSRKNGTMNFYNSTIFPLKTIFFAPSVTASPSNPIYITVANTSINEELGPIHTPYLFPKYSRNGSSDQPSPDNSRNDNGSSGPGNSTDHSDKSNSGGESDTPDSHHNTNHKDHHHLSGGAIAGIVIGILLLLLLVALILYFTLRSKEETSVV